MAVLDEFYDEVPVLVLNLDGGGCYEGVVVGGSKRELLLLEVGVGR